MKDLKWDKFVLNNKIATKLGWKPSHDKILCFHARFQIGISWASDIEGRILCFHARFQTGISWASDIEINQFKIPNSSMCLGLQLWWRIQSEINSFWITELQPNSAGNLLAAGFYVFTLDFK